MPNTPSTEHKVPFSYIKLTGSAHWMVVQVSCLFTKFGLTPWRVLQQEWKNNANRADIVNAFVTVTPIIVGPQYEFSCYNSNVWKF
jgi:hypothetical protein